MAKSDFTFLPLISTSERGGIACISVTPAEPPHNWGYSTFFHTFHILYYKY